MSRKIILIALLASACAAFAFDRDHLIHAAPSCPSSWPQTLPISSPLVSFPLYQHDGFYTDTNGQNWYIIIGTDSNRYTTARAYLADDRYRIGYTPGRARIAMLRRNGHALATPTCVLQRAEPEAEPVKIVQLHGFEPVGLSPAYYGWYDRRRYVPELHTGVATVNSDMVVVPGLAEGWEVSQGGRTYTFHLRPTARFHDGKRVTAADVLWSWEWMPTQSNYAQGVIFHAVDQTTVIDAQTLRVDLIKPFYDFPARITFRRAFIMDKQQVADGDDWKLDPNGTGPYRVAEYSPGNRLVFEANRDYFAGPPQVDQLRYNLCENCDREAMYAAGLIDVWEIPRQKIDGYIDHPDLRKGPPAWDMDYLVLNPYFPPFDDPNVRLALNLAIDRSKLSSGTPIQPATSIVPSAMSGYDVADYHYDPERAKQLLSESKYGPDTSTYPPIVFSSPRGSTPRHSRRVVSEAWQALGLPVSHTNIEQNITGYRALFRNFEIQLAGDYWIPDYPQPTTYLYDLFHSRGITPLMPPHPTYDALLDRALAEEDREARDELYRQAEHMLLWDIVPWVPVYHTDYQYFLAKPHISGLPLGPMILPYGRQIGTTKLRWLPD